MSIVFRTTLNYYLLNIVNPLSISTLSDAPSLNCENPDSMPIYGHDERPRDNMPIYGGDETQVGNEEPLYEESSGAGGAPVIISVEEIERLKTEMAISFSGPQGTASLPGFVT